MSRSYRHIQNYEKKIKKMLEHGLTHREIGEALGFSNEQGKGFVKLLHIKKQKLAAGKTLKMRGRPAKDDKHSVAVICLSVAGNPVNDVRFTPSHPFGLRGFGRLVGTD